MEHAMQAPVSDLLRRCLISAIVLLPAVVLLVLVPTRLGHFIVPGCVGPLRLHFDDLMVTMHLPLEMLVYHVLVPVVLERVRRRDGLRALHPDPVAVQDQGGQRGTEKPNRERKSTS